MCFDLIAAPKINALSCIYYNPRGVSKKRSLNWICHKIFTGKSYVIKNCPILKILKFTNRETLLIVLIQGI